MVTISFIFNKTIRVHVQRTRKTLRNIVTVYKKKLYYYTNNVKLTLVLMLFNSD